MTIKKALVLYISLTSSLWANGADDLPIAGPQMQQKKSLKAEHRKRQLSEHKNEFSQHQKRLKDTATITINPHKLTHEQMVAFMRFTQESGIEAECPSPLTKAYEPIKHLFEQKVKSPVPILTMDGGGVRGIIEARICEYIETRAEIPIYKLFQLVAATSTGGIIGGGLCFNKPLPKESNSNAPLDESTDLPTCQEPISAKEIVELYRTMAKEIFSEYYYTSLGGLRGTQYGNGPAIKAYQQFYGQARFSEAKTPFILTAQNLSASKPYIFSSQEDNENLKNLENLENQEFNQEVWKAMTAATAAPTYFDPREISGKKIGDGGISNNNPVLIAIQEACKLFNVKPNELLILSLGTGMVQTNPDKSFEGLTALGWLDEISTNIFNGEAQNYIAKKLINNSKNSDFFKSEGELLRLQPTLTKELYHLSKYDPQYLDQLLKKADDYIEENKEALDRFIEKVVISYKIRTAQ